MRHKLAKGAKIVELSRSIVDEVLIKDGEYLQACMLKKNIPLEERKAYIGLLQEQLGIIFTCTEEFTSFYSAEPLKVIKL